MNSPCRMISDGGELTESFSLVSVNGHPMCLNIYDVRLEDTRPACGLNWPPDIKNITVYLDVCPIHNICAPHHNDYLSLAQGCCPGNARGEKVRAVDRMSSSVAQRI
jgi:hypothetical protein